MTSKKLPSSTPLEAFNDALGAVVGVNLTDGEGERVLLAAFTGLTISSGLNEEDSLLGCKE